MADKTWSEIGREIDDGIEELCERGDWGGLQRVRDLYIDAVRDRKLRALTACAVIEAIDRAVEKHRAARKGMIGHNGH